MSKGAKERATELSTHQLGRPVWRRFSKPTEAVFRCFPELPGEVKNVLYEILIQTALNTPKNPSKSSDDANCPSKTPFTITALPRWSGPPVLKFTGIGNLEILFTSKKVYTEVSTLLYRHLDTLTLGGYTLQHRADDPRARWLAAFAALQRRPGLLNEVKYLTIKLPNVREQLFRNHLLPFGVAQQSHPSSDFKTYQKCWAGVPHMIAFLEKCSALQDVQIVVTAVEGRPLMIDAWCGAVWEMVHLRHLGAWEMAVEFNMDGRDTIENLDTLIKWTRAWREYLEVKQKEIMAGGLARALE